MKKTFSIALAACMGLATMSFGTLATAAPKGESKGSARGARSDSKKESKEDEKDKEKEKEKSSKKSKSKATRSVKPTAKDLYGKHAGA